MGRGGRRSLLRQADRWPAFSPGAANAWLLLATTKPPVWQDPLVRWRDLPLTVGEPHEGFFYPDPLGFWAEVRRWATDLVRAASPGLGMSDALALSLLVHLESDPSQLARARALARPALVLFLDEPGLASSGLAVAGRVGYRVPDPHRPTQVYEGFWGRLDDGTVVGKAPQHPAAHRLYRPEDMSAFLRAAPLAAA